MDDRAQHAAPLQETMGTARNDCATLGPASEGS